MILNQIENIDWSLSEKIVILLSTELLICKSSWIMNEEFIQYLWKFRLLNKDLFTIDHKPIEVIDPGLVNTNGGPDISTCKIKIEDTLWVGNAEIHTSSSDWFKHKHDNDAAYDNLILHIVFDHNSDCILRENGEVIPTLEIAGKFELGLWDRYQHLSKSKKWIPCAGLIDKVKPSVWLGWYDRLLTERLERKSRDILALFDRIQHNWDETFYVMMASGFGVKVNRAPFELLSKSIPGRILARHKDNLLQLEALFFGQANLLPDNPKDAYCKALKREYQFLAHKFGLQPLPKGLWNFLRMRPSNFPTLRLSQLAHLIYKRQSLFSLVRECRSVDELYSVFKVKASTYWDNHYVFEKEADLRVKILGKNAIDLIIINTIVPFLFIYGKHKANAELQERALSFLYQIHSEQNSIIRNFKSLGVNSKSAFESQALIELKNGYCRYKKCLNCRIGNHLLRSDI